MTTRPWINAKARLWWAQLSRRYILIWKSCSYENMCMICLGVCFPHNFVLRVSFSSAPECVDVDYWNRLFVWLPCGPRNTVIVVVIVFSLISTYSFLTKAGLLEADFHYIPIFWIFAAYRCFPQLYVEGLLSSAPECVDRVCWNPLFFDPPRGPRNTVTIIVIVFPLVFTYSFLIKGRRI